ncbi:hypothetical protein HN51_054499, partial [Arachis hypogaea]
MPKTRVTKQYYPCYFHHLKKQKPFITIAFTIQQTSSSRSTHALFSVTCYDFPASILCSTESSILCHNCNWESHNLSLPTVHERGPLEGVTACPS